MMHVTNLKSITNLFFFSLICLSYTGSWDSLTHGSNDVDETDLFTIYVENNQGERVENAWVTISLTNKSDQALITGPTQYIEFNHEGSGRYSARIQPHQLEGRKIVLTVYAEHHVQYEEEMERFEREVRVELRFDERSTTEAITESNIEVNDGLLRAEDVPSLGEFFEVVVSNNLGHPINNAAVRLEISDRSLHQGTIRQNRLMYLNRTDEGTYVTDSHIFLDQTNELKVAVSAPDHELVEQEISGRNNLYRVELYHNNYYQKCNQNEYQAASSTFLSWSRDLWDNCEVNKNDLIESFGIEEKNILNSTRQRNHLFNTELFKYAPEISNDYSNYAPRYSAYRTILDHVLLATSISLASVQNRELVDWIEAEMSSNRTISNSELMLKGAEFISGFSETFANLNRGLQVAGYTLDILRAKREGYLEGLLMVIAYNGAAEEILDWFDELSLSGWLKDDRALHNAISDTRSELERMKERNMEEIIHAVSHQRVGDVLNDILLGVSIKSAMNATGLAVSSIVTGSASPAVLAAANKLIASYLIYDFLNSISRTGEQRALLSAILQMDRQMFFDVPDHFEWSVAESLNHQQKLDMLMRLNLGILFNEARAALFAGEFRTWIGYQFQYSKKGARNANQAYELKMAEISLEKAEAAENDIEDLISFWFENNQSENEETDSFFDALAVTGTYERFQLADDPDRDRATINITAIEGGKVSINGQALYFPRGDASFGPNIGEFNKQTELQRVNYLEDAMGCSLRIEFKDERMLVEELNRGTMSPCGGHNVTFQGEYRREEDAGEKETLISKGFNDVPLAIRNSILSVYNNPCHDMQHPENVYLVNNKDEKNLLYFVWEIGCPLTRGRGSIWVFDSDSGKIVGNDFGYHITGYPPFDLLEFEFSTSSAYPDFIFTGTRSSPKPRFIFNNKLNEYEMDYNHVSNSVTDIDGNRYKTVRIGEQLWMAENLRTSTYSNGDNIPNITDHDEWQELETGAWAYYENNSNYHEPYGKLYNWFAVDDSRGLCPTGWRVPDGSDWFEMKTYLGLEEDDIIFGNGGYFASGRGSNLAGKIMETDVEYWEGNNHIANNESGFSGLPGGQRNFLGFINFGTAGHWWSSSDPSKGGEGARSLIQNYRAISSGGFPPRQTGYSVRCVKE